MGDAHKILTEREGTLLGTVVRTQPVTAYQLLKIHEESPTSSINQSKGSVYPMIHRLIERGLLVATVVQEDARKTEMLNCTPAGLDAVRSWVKSVSLDHILVADPLRTRLLSLDLLDRDEQLDWIVHTQDLVEEKKRQVEDFDSKVDLPFKSIARANSLLALEAQQQWLELLLKEVIRARPPR